MSSEILPVTEGDTSSSTQQDQPWDLLDPRTVFNPNLCFDLIGGDYHTKQYLASEKGHKYVKQLNPTLISVKPFLDDIKEPSVLLLRGCDLLLQSPGFPFDKFKSITTLEISGCRYLNSLPENTISQMTNLQSLDLSYLQIDQLPPDLFENAADSLRSLVISGCSYLNVLPEPRRPLKMLEYLDLSHLPIESLPCGFIRDRLRSIILRGCFKLRSLEVWMLEKLHFLDLSQCTSLTALYISMTVSVLDLSYTALDWWNLPSYVTHLFFRNAKLCDLDGYISFEDLKVCDLSGNQDLGDVRTLRRCSGLEALNLSKTRIESIDFLSWLTCMRALVLQECNRLKELPSFELLEKLELLDLSGCEILCDLPQDLSNQTRLKELNLCGCKGLTELMEGLFDDMVCLEKLDLSNTNIKNLPSLANLINRGTVIIHPCDSVLQNSTVPMELVNLCRDNVDSRHEFHLVSTFISNSGFDNFIYRFTELNRYLLFLEEKFSRSVDTKATRVKGKFQSMRVDLEYILGKVDLLESSEDCRSSEELLHQLMSYDYDNYDDDPSSILKKLLRTVTKLKVLVPPLPPKLLSFKEVNELKESSISGNTAFWFKSRNLTDEYESLTTTQRNCLLYFTCLTVPISGDKMIKGSILIHLWYGEGFFDPLLYASSTNDDANQQVSSSNYNSAIGEIGREILHVLAGKGFIWFRKEERKWYMEEPNSSFLIKKAMEEHSFDFNKRGKLTPQFSVSTRACLLKSDIDHLPSSQVWLNYTKSAEKLQRFKTLRTLLYIDEPIVDINAEWFSCMTNLHVLHLVNLYSEQINIVDLKFLEELKDMKQLRLLNLESFAAIQQLPDSICELTNLRILNLKYCSNLMELPTGIASLSNLTILDLTQCHLLPQLPKGLASLSKLEVLKGFPVTYDADGRQSKKACTLRELLKLKSLRKLNLVVNKDSFPDNRDLQVLRSMKELLNLKITWYPAICKEEELGDAIAMGALRQSRWKQFKCWGPQHETEEVDDELLLTNTSLGNLNKLVLCCFPFETAPNWLHPAELQNLERLHIVGGRLKTLFEDQTKWKIKALKLKYLSNLRMDWETVRFNFRCMTYNGYEKQCCPHVENFEY